ncbi:cytochrome ubiquinol oxidase subunit I [Hansschlegelia beijingensis]|uniref:Cytochrome d ubiquinol oxidase subunit I n=1 Tax=Hansschlegelia beijingensis TaxID=1133344 RepID=A0A7W6CYK9_9HYPH|nr:cytochrome ubiquinol oxidase subunit I [Hansschlegelia beijingensis]MBB3973480.1 cytochrome d ubiquinol oxidase subunit I [Hansschlegelia beijingensis]
MDFDPNLLARLQFAFTVSFHIVFPAFTIGISAYVATLLLIWARTGADRFHRLARFWTKIFAVSFAMGVVSGIVLSYQFGTNWSRYSEVVGNVVAPLIGYEVLTAFFLEATFLGIMLFGWDRVPAWLHVLSACIVALGTAISGFWILSANSWMQTPAGFEMRDGVAHPLDWVQIIFNPSFPYRFAHMMTAAYLTTAVVVLSVGCRYLLANRFGEDARTMVRMAIGMIAIVAPLQLFIGDQHGLNTLEHQPAKVAAMEGHWNSDEPVALSLFAIPNVAEERNDFDIALPNLSSVILTHSWDGRIKGLSDFPKDERPPVLPVFFAFRIMVAIGFALIATGLVGAWLWWRGTLWETRWYLKTSSYLWPLGFIAILAGWIVTEVGRQPWVAWGILRTADASSPVTTGSLVISLAMFVVVYCCVFSMGVYYINRLINRGPDPSIIAPPRQGAPNRPLSAAQDATRGAIAGGPEPAAG